MTRDRRMGERGPEVDISGMKFGRWTALQFSRMKIHSYWLCQCECGTERDVCGVHLNRGKSKSCGCLRNETTKKMRLDHGASEMSEFGIWENIKFRTTQNIDHPNAKNYAMRGIFMCVRWRNSFSYFLSDMGPRPSTSHSIDRIDNDRGYEPGNCRWATPKEQMRNTRCNRIVEYEGRKVTLVEAAELSGINYGTLKWRLNQGNPLYAKVRKR